MLEMTGCDQVIPISPCARLRFRVFIIFAAYVAMLVATLLATKTSVADSPIVERPGSTASKIVDPALRSPLDDDDDDDDYFRPIGFSNRLTVSFAPDGTSIFRHQSSLYASFSNIMTQEELEQSILQAFNLWAREGNLDVGIVSDSGDPFGVAGRSVGDERFGDVRIGAYPMASDVYAIALKQEDFVSGTWSGDILFNSNAIFQDADHFFAIALHEAGHALGMDHSDDPSSAMFPFSTNQLPSPGDIANFRVIYGQRQLDSYDSDGYNNDRFESATELKFEDEFGPEGTYPSIVFGDIATGTDNDFFVLPIPSEYTGPISFRVVSAGISLLAPKISILDEFGQLITDDFSNSLRGDEITLTISSAQINESVYIQVTGATPTDTGSYSLISTLDNRLIVSEESINHVAKSSEFTYMEQEDIDDYLSNPTGYLFNDDDHSDDDHASAFQLETEDGFALQSRFRRSASLLDENDIDVYVLNSPSFDPAIEMLNMIVSLRSVETGDMIPITLVYDEDSAQVPSTVIVNGLGEHVIQVAAIQPETTYFIHVATDDFLPFNNGNYEMTISFSDRPVAFAEFASGRIGNYASVASRSQKRFQSLHVAESQMFQFAFEVDEVSNNADAMLWVTVYNDLGEPIYQAATRDGERRTTHAAYFSPGSYLVEFEIASRTGGLASARRGITYRLLGIDIGDPQGPEFNDPTQTPFDQTKTGQWVYPDDVVSDATFVFVNGIASNLPSPPTDNPPSDLYLWYWFGI